VRAFFLSSPPSAGPKESRRGTIEGVTVTTIRASCPTCGDVELTINDVSVRVCSANERGSYAFQCPRCAIVINKPAERRIIDLLITAGVRCHTWDLPLELFERRDGDPISYDDLLDFHAQLQDPNWFDRVVALVEQP
jgi:hypothetical protein